MNKKRFVFFAKRRGGEEEQRKKEKEEEDIGEEEEERKGEKEINIESDPEDKPVCKPTYFSGTTLSCGLGMQSGRRELNIGGERRLERGIKKKPFHTGKQML